MPLNPRSAYDEVNGYTAKSDQDKARTYPQFFSKIRFNTFRHLNGLTFEFKHPITVISGSNRSGKTSTLMAIACSHYNFMRHNVTNGAWDRATWGMLMRFTQNDIQSADWSYNVEYREGSNSHNVHGYRKRTSKKWGGVAKKSRQIGRPTVGHPNGGRTCTLIDLNRIIPGRHLSQSYYDKARKAAPADIPNKDKVNEYLSYIFEDNYEVKGLADAADGKVYKYTTAHQYSSFNTASGEDVLTSMLADILRTPNYSLILIDEIELGLHPKVQRRLMEILYIISQKEYKQFIITSHSYAVINFVPAEARIFVELANGNYRVIPGLTTYEALTRMDSAIFPVSTVYVEDDISSNIVNKAIQEINAINQGFSRLLRVIDVGSADRTYNYFAYRSSLRERERITTKAACVLDGDMQNKRDGNGDLKYPAQAGLFFHFSSEAPEKMLLRKFLALHPNAAMQYHLDNSDPHCLLQKMFEEGLAISKEDAFEQCFKEYRASADGSAHFEELKNFLQSLTN